MTSHGATMAPMKTTRMIIAITLYVLAGLWFLAMGVLMPDYWSRPEPYAGLTAVLVWLLPVVAAVGTGLAIWPWEPRHRPQRPSPFRN